jgi:osmotically-inducible protein OsmY
MKNRNTLVGALAALGLFAAAAGATEASDSMITAKIKAELAGHKSVSALDTKVETSDGIVTLTGSAKSEAEKELAERYARDVQGVKDVDNQIAVKGEQAGESAQAGEGAPAEDQSGGGVKADRGAGSRLLDKMSNGSVSSRVRSALEANRGTSDMHPTVETKDGVVILYGTATSEAQKDLAERLAKGVNGVKSVDNEINVKAPEEK